MNSLTMIAARLSGRNPRLMMQRKSTGGNSRRVREACTSGPAQMKTRPGFPFSKRLTLKHMATTQR